MVYMLKTQKPLSWFLRFQDRVGLELIFDARWTPFRVSDLVAGAGIEPASGGSFTPAVSNWNGLYHNPIRTLPL